MADAGAYRWAEKKNPGSHTREDMLTGFVQNIEIFCLFPLAFSHVCPGEKAVQIRPVRLSETAFHIFAMKSEK